MQAAIGALNQTRSTSTPVAGQTLSSAAQASGFKSGSCFDPSVYNADAPYAALLRAQADVYTAENVMKESAIWTAASTYNFTNADAFMAIAAADGKQVRGHVLFYPVKASAWQTGGGLTSGNWQALCDAYIQAVLTRPSLAAVDDWDVVNEVCSGDTDGDGFGYVAGLPHLTAAGSGDAFLHYVFNRAAFYAPTKRHFLCESNVEFGGGSYKDTKRANVIAVLTRALNAGVRIDGYSMQMHLRPDPVAQDYRFDRQKLRDFCKSLMALGLKINITEIDVQFPSGGWTGTNAEWDRRAAEYVFSAVDTVLDTTSGTASFPDHVSCWGLSDKYTAWPDNPGDQRSAPFDSSFGTKTMFTALMRAFAGANS